MAFRDDLKKEKKKLSRLSFGEKLQYIFDYYKFWILGVVVLVGLVWSVGSTILHNKPTGFYAMLLNAGGTDLSGQADEAAGAAFAEAAGLDDTKQKILVDTSATFNPNDQSQFSMAQNAKIAALYQTHEIDVMVADPGVFTYYALNGSFVDLRDVLDDETLAEYEAAGQVYYIDQHLQELVVVQSDAVVEHLTCGISAMPSSGSEVACVARRANAHRGQHAALAGALEPGPRRGARLQHRVEVA